MQIPLSINDLTVKQFQEINQIIRTEKDCLESHIKLISCLFGKSIEWVESHTPAQIGAWAREIDKLLKSPINKKVKSFIRAGKHFYKPMLEIQNIKAGQLIALKFYEERASGTQVHLHNQLACVFTRLTWYGKAKKYNSSDHEDIASDMLEAKVGEVYGVLFFYTNVFEKLNLVTQTYLTSATELIKETMPEVLEWARKNPEIVKKAGLKVL